MKNIIKSSLFKLFKDKTFRVTLIVGAVLSVFLVLLYLAIDNGTGSGQHIMCNGKQFLVASAAPLSNFAIAVPINLSIMIIGEFTYGTIRNKVIVGYRKSYIYFSLFLVGVIFTLSLMLIYTALSVGLASIIGGFDPLGTYTLEMAMKWIAITISGYIFITSLCVFAATATRNQGLSLGLIIGILTILIIGSTVYVVQSVGNHNTFYNPETIVWLHPLFFQTSTTIGSDIFGSGSLFTSYIEPRFFAGAVISPLIYSGIFYLIGSLIFKKRDLK